MEKISWTDHVRNGASHGQAEEEYPTYNKNQRELDLSNLA
jgi:hypothetical protein